MNNDPAQQDSATTARADQQPACLCHDMLDCPDQATVAINANQLARIAELLVLLDGFLRSDNGIADRLADHLHLARGHHPHHSGYDANLLIDQVSFTAHNLATHLPNPLK
jgi:hypothetical protein